MVKNRATTLTTIGCMLLLCLTLLFSIACKSTPSTSPTSAAPSPSTTQSTPKPTTSSPPSSPTPPSSTSDAADFFARNTVTLISNYGAGGGSDYAARVFASFWTDITGGPMVVKNKVGAGGVIGANDVFAAKPDGLTLGGGAIMGTTFLGPVFLQDPAVKFELSKFNWIGFFAEDPWTLTVGAKLPYKSMADLQKTDGIRFAAHGVKAGPAMGGALMIHLFNLKNAKVIFGYAGSVEMALAIAKGEAEIEVMEASGVQADADKGFVKPALLAISNERNKWFPDAPSTKEVMTLNAEQQKLLDTFETIFWSGKVFYAPPGVPADRIKFIREVFDKMMTNDGFLKTIKTRFPVWTTPISGQDLENKVKAKTNIPKADIDLFIRTVEKYAK